MHKTKDRQHIADGLYLAEKHKLLLVLKLQVLYIDSFLHSHSLLYRWLCKLSTCAELTDGTSLLEFPLEFLESLLNVLAFFYRYYNHAKITSFLFEGAKIDKYIFSANFYIISLRKPRSLQLLG